MVKLVFLFCTRITILNCACVVKPNLVNHDGSPLPDISDLLYLIDYMS